MSENTSSEPKKSFWETLPGILTSVATVLTALTGLLALFINQNKKEAAATKNVAAVEEAPRERNTERSVDRRIPRNVPSRIDVTGLWKDPTNGTQLRIIQQGNSITTMTFNPMTGQQLAQGWGRISGRRIEGQNNWLDGSSYFAEATISEDGQQMSGSFRNRATNQTGNLFLTR